MDTYEVQRKVIAWEKIYVEAESFEEAVEKAQGSYDWDLNVYDYERTDDFWVQNQETDEQRDL